MACYLGNCKPDFNRIEIEIRLWWTTSIFDSVHNLVVINQSNTGTWKLISYAFPNEGYKNNKPFKSLSKELSQNWQSKWDTILAAKLLNIPDQMNVRKKWTSTKGGRIGITDGSMYAFEILTKKRKRSFEYSNPHEYLSFYDLKNDGLNETVMFIRMILSEIN